MEDGPVEVDTRWTDDQVWLPERVDVPDICCVRVCDQPATTFLLWPRDAAPGDTLSIYATCWQHIISEAP